MASVCCDCRHPTPGSCHPSLPNETRPPADPSAAPYAKHAKRERYPIDPFIDVLSSRPSSACGHRSCCPLQHFYDLDVRGFPERPVYGVIQRRVNRLILFLESDGRPWPPPLFEPSVMSPPSPHRWRAPTFEDEDGTFSSSSLHYSS